MERWASIPDFPAYEASDRGRIRRVGPAQGSKVGRILRPTSNGKDYVRVSLRRDSAYHSRYVHQLVLAAFVGPCPAGHVTDHRNAKRSDNRLANLSYVTSSENNARTYRRGRRVGPSATITFEQVGVIRERLKRAIEEIASSTGVAPRVIERIAKKQTWKWSAAKPASTATKYCSHGCEVTEDSHDHESKGNCYGGNTYDCSCDCHEYNVRMERTLFTSQTGDTSFTLTDERPSYETPDGSGSAGGEDD